MMNAGAERACTYALGLTHDPLTSLIQLVRGATEFRVVLAALWAPESRGCRTPVVMVPLHLRLPAV